MSKLVVEENFKNWTSRPSYMAKFPKSVDILTFCPIKLCSIWAEIANSWYQSYYFMVYLVHAKKLLKL